MTRILFGVNLSTSAAPGADPVRDALAAEEFGFDFVSASDHPGGTAPTFETATMLTWVAAATTRITVASRVLAVPLRPPAMVAKMAESLDRLSGGRLILGLGAGYSDDELRSFGLPALSPAEKVDGLADAVRVIRGLWSEPGFSYQGSRYHTDSADLEPKPDHPIPIWLGTFGNRALAVTGRLADGWIPSLGYASEERLPEMRARVLAAASAAGRDPADITCALNVQVRVGGRDAGGRDAGGGRAEDDPAMLSGPPGRVIERLNGFVALGFTAFNVIPAGPGAPDQVTRFATEVIPAIRP